MMVWDDWRAIGVGALVALALVVSASLAHASEQKPSEALCWLARKARDMAGGERQAEHAARVRGVSEAVIAAAKRCPPSAR